MIRFAYHRPGTLGEALALARESPAARYIAGGTDLLVAIRAGHERPHALISLGRIGTLRRIDLGSTIRIGSRVTISEILEHPELTEAHPVLAQAARPFGSVQIRNLATIGGNLCHASPAADLAPVLLALDARVRLEGPEGARTMPLESFFVGPGRTTLAGGEVLTEIVLDGPEPGARASFQRHARVGMDIALTNIAVRLTIRDGLVSRVRIAAGAVAPQPIRLRAAERRLEGAEIGPESLADAARIAASEIDPISDIRASAGYRRRLTAALLRRAVTAAAGGGTR